MKEIWRSRAMNMIWSMVVMLASVLIGVLVAVIVGFSEPHGLGVVSIGASVGVLVMILGVLGGFIYYLVSLYRFSNVQPDYDSQDWVRTIFRWQIISMAVAFVCSILGEVTDSIFFGILPPLVGLVANIIIIVNYGRLSRCEYYPTKAKTGASFLMWAGIISLSSLLFASIGVYFMGLAGLGLIGVCYLTALVLNFVGWAMIAGGSPEWEE